LSGAVDQAETGANFSNNCSKIAKGLSIPFRDDCGPRGTLSRLSAYVFCRKDCGMDRSFVPADIIIAELKKQAADVEEQVESAAEPLATELREKAKLLRAWILDLRLGRWTAFRS
jgi:hypothetical protein